MNAFQRLPGPAVAFIVIFLVCVVARWASAEDAHGPFGLLWGMSADDAKKAGVILTPLSGPTDYGTAYTATNLPKVLSDVESCIVAFGYQDRLARIAAVGREIDNDPYGGQVLARYRELGQSLTERYGKAHEIDQRDTQLYKAPNEYVMSLKLGRAHRYMTFEDSNTRVELSIRATSGSVARYAIIFESIPEVNKLDADKKAKEKDAL